MSSSILQADQAGADLPDHKQLPESDGSAMPNMQQPPQTAILLPMLTSVLAAVHPDGQYCLTGDSFIYFKHTQPVLEGCRAPDLFYVPGVPPLLNGEIRRSYVLWRERVPPLFVVEYVSGNGSEERDTTPETGKFWIYEQAICAAYYVIFDPKRASLEAHQLVQGSYRQMTANAQGRYPIAPLGIEFGVWEGSLGNLPGAWLRVWSATGEMLPLAEERAEAAEAGLEETRSLLGDQIAATATERKRAEDQANLAAAEHKRAEDQARRAALFAEKLRALGINPDELAAP